MAFSKGEWTIFLAVLGSLQTAFMCETFYRQYAIPDSSVQGQRGPIAPTTADFQSIFCLESISVFVLQYLRHVERQLRCLLLTVTSDQNSVYFSKAASTVSQSCKGGVKGNNLST